MNERLYPDLISYMHKCIFIRTYIQFTENDGGTFREEKVVTCLKSGDNKIHERRVHVLIRVAEKSFEKRKWGGWELTGYRYMYEKDKNINGRRKGFS